MPGSTAATGSSATAGSTSGSTARPDRVGYQHGTLLSKEIEDLLRVVKPFLAHTTKRDWDFYRKAAETMLWKHVEPEYQQEIDGIVEGLNAKGVKADRWDLVALNALEELPYYYVPWLDRKEGKTPSSHAPGNCTAFVATGKATKDGKIVMGHNSWTNYIVGLAGTSSSTSIPTEVTGCSWMGCPA